ncbi:MAG: DUF2231 domain-containing protein [Actinomycetota bacterium]
MFSRIKIFGHPVHPMVVAYPIAFYTATLVAFVVFAANDSLLTFRIAVVANVAGVAMALVAAVPGFLDWLLGIPRATPARATGLYHMLLNVSALVLFAINALVHLGQWNDASPDKALGIVLSGLGVGLTVAPASWDGPSSRITTWVSD